MFRIAPVQSLHVEPVERVGWLSPPVCRRDFLGLDRTQPFQALGYIRFGERQSGANDRTRASVDNRECATMQCAALCSQQGRGILPDIMRCVVYEMSCVICITMCVLSAGPRPCRSQIGFHQRWSPGAARLARHCCPCVTIYKGPPGCLSLHSPLSFLLRSD